MKCNYRQILVPGLVVARLPTEKKYPENNGIAPTHIVTTFQGVHTSQLYCRAALGATPGTSKTCVRREQQQQQQQQQQHQCAVWGNCALLDGQRPGGMRTGKKRLVCQALDFRVGWVTWPLNSSPDCP
eukprot:1155248-Pelagomonas_calceolata.AAC.1